MNSLDTQIQAATERLVDAIIAVAEEALRAGVEGGALPRSTRGKQQRPAVVQSAKEQALSGAGAQVLKLLESNGGLRAEQITRWLGLTPSHTRGVLDGLRAAGKVVQTGKARGTVYSIP